MLGLMKEIKDRHEKYADIAERYSVDANTVWRWAAGNVNPTLDTARRLSADYGKPIEYLFSEAKEESNPTQPPAGLGALSIFSPLRSTMSAVNSGVTSAGLKMS